VADNNAVIINTPITNNDFTIQTKTESLLKEHQTDWSVNFSKQNSINIILPDELKIKKNN